MPLPVGLLLVACIAAAGVLKDLGIAAVPFPQTNRQVPTSIFDRGAVHAALLFGFEMGTGLLTFVSASAPYVLASAILLLDLPFWGVLAAGAGFGFGRAATPLSRAMSGDMRAWDAALLRSLKPIKLVAIAIVTVGFTAEVL